MTFVYTSSSSTTTTSPTLQSSLDDETALDTQVSIIQSTSEVLLNPASATSVSDFSDAYTDFNTAISTCEALDISGVTTYMDSLSTEMTNYLENTQIWQTTPGSSSTVTPLHLEGTTTRVTLSDWANGTVDGGSSYTINTSTTETPAALNSSGYPATESSTITINSSKGACDIWFVSVDGDASADALESSLDEL